MTTTIAAYEERTLSGRVIFLIGESQIEQLRRLLAEYLGQPDVERVVLVATTAAAAARIAAPYAEQREQGRLATVLADDDLPGALRAASRGWGEPDVLINTLDNQRHAAPIFAPLSMAFVAA
jgi:hypothetical protein